MSASFAPKLTPRRMFPGISPAARAARACAFAAALTALVTLLPAVAPAATATGTLTGVIRNADGGPEPWVTVMVPGTVPQLGAQSDAAGVYTIKGVPEGTWRLSFQKLGFDTGYVEAVRVAANAVAHQDFTVKEQVVKEMEEIKVIGVGQRINLTGTDTRHPIFGKDSEHLPVEGVEGALALKPGVVIQAGQIHFRGVRADEIQYQIDGVPVTDRATGANVEIATNSVYQTDALLGGFDAEYGNAQGGIVNISTQEGGTRFAGNVTYSTDDFGAPDKTYDNFDRLEASFGGPSGVRGLTWFLSMQGTFQDGYLKTSEQRPRHTLLDFIRVGPRQENDIKFQSKLAWTPAPGRKLTFETLRNRTDKDLYSHVFSRTGWVQTRTDTLRATGEILTRYGNFSATPLDSTYVPYNAAAHVPDQTSSFGQIKLVWTHALSKGTNYSVRLSRHAYDFESSLPGRQPWDYTARYPDQWRDAINNQASRFFATNGDYPEFTQRSSVTWTLKSDWTHQAGRHRLKSGAELAYNNLRQLSLRFPLQVGTDGRPGGNRSDYRYQNPEGSFYLQDQWDHEGMVVNAGGRLDLFSVGSQFLATEVEQRWRRQFSPRLGIAYPISDRDVFSFHYGRFSQTPSRQYIFENRGSAAPVRGNPNLQNENTMSYQAALQHMFTPDVFGQFSVYFKDIFGLMSIDQSSAGDNPQLISTWINRDYASARGFELSLEKRFTHNFSGELSYGYGYATGVASDPNQQRNTALLYLPIAEQPLDWDQRHTVSAQALLSQPDEWLMNVVWTYGSGFPFTPSRRDERKQDPKATNAGRLPSATNLSVQAEKHYRVWGQDVKFFVRANNLLDATNIFQLEPTNWPNPPGTNANDYRAFYTETGRAGGAYLGDDTNSDGVPDWVPVNDPRVFMEGRTVRMGAGVKF